MTYETLLLSIDSNVATVTLNRPKVLNALNQAMLYELEELFTELDLHRDVQVILLRGAGEKAFAAGADISELASGDASTGEQLAGRAQRIFRRIETMGKPVIACIHGFALGGGCELALACTLLLANHGARLGQPEIKLGLIPGYGGTQRLPRLVGRGAALKLLLTGTIIDGSEALRIGLVDELIDGDMDQLVDRAQELATLIAGMPPLAVRAMIEAVDRGADLPLDEALAFETSVFAKLFDTQDMREGTRAFLEKRPAKWSGR